MYGFYKYSGIFSIVLNPFIPAKKLRYVVNTDFRDLFDMVLGFLVLCFLSIGPRT